MFDKPTVLSRSLASRWTAALAMGLIAALSATAATAQTRPALVRSVDEPARVPYAHFLAPTCPFGNVCQATFPEVPVGKRLRLTQVSFFSLGVSSTTGIFVVYRLGTSSPLLIFPVNRVNTAYYSSTSLVGTFAVDLIFEAGERPFLELGVPAGAGGIPANGFNRYGVTGYLVDVLP